MPAQPRRRLQFKFWLNENNPDEKWLIEVCDWLMEQKKFVSSVRDGLRLIFDLRYQRSTASLLELFPDIRDMLNVEQKPAPNTGGGGELQEIKNMLEIALSQVKDDNRYVMQTAIPTSAPKVSNLPAVPIAVAVAAKAPDADKMADDFLSQMMGLI